MLTSRRDFLCTASAAAIAGLSAREVLAAEMKKAKSGVPAKWDMTTDVVVAGSGPSGMGAAVAAVDAGAQVLVFEKGDNYGGCGIICAGILQLEGGTRFQKEHGIKDSPELYYQRLTSPKAKDHHGMDPKIAWQMAQRFPEFLDWSEKHGVKYRSFQAEAVDSQHSGAWHHLSWPEPGEGAMMVPPNKDGYVTGAGLMIPLKNYFLEKGGKILMHHKVTDVIQDETGRAVGVVVEADGKTLNVRAKKGVILAAGSWKANKALRKLSDGRFSENMISTGDPFVTPDGSGIIAAMRAGGMLARDYSKATSCVRRKFGTAHYNFPMGSKWGAPGLSCAGARWAQLIFTNKDGDRFIREVDKWDLGIGYNFYDAALAQPEQKLWIVYDDETAKRFRWSTQPPMCEEGLAFDAPTIEELAKVTGQKNLVETVARYNKFVDAKKDDDFGKPAEMLTKKIEKGPFHAVRCILCVHNLCCGVAVNENFQVLSYAMEPVPGLCAVGENAGGFYPGGVAGGMTTGRIAGEFIVKNA